MSCLMLFISAGAFRSCLTSLGALCIASQLLTAWWLSLHHTNLPKESFEPVGRNQTSVEMRHND